MRSGRRLESRVSRQLWSPVWLPDVELNHNLQNQYLPCYRLHYRAIRTITYRAKNSNPQVKIRERMENV